MGNDTVKCPHCGEESGDLWEYFGSSNDECVEASCGSCGKDFTLTRIIDVDYEVIAPLVEEVVGTPPGELLDPATSKPLVTLEDHARAWWRERGKEMPSVQDSEGMKMYEEWVEQAFADLHSREPEVYHRKYLERDHLGRKKTCPLCKKED